MATLASRITDLANAVAAAIKAQRGVQAFCGGKPAASELIGSAIAPYAMTLSAARSSALSGAAATASAVFLIKAGGTQIGTLTWSAGATAAVVAYTTTAIAVGAQISIVAPATQDATLADLTIALRP